ncbi:MAG: hypothetical protein AABY22_16860 [Nanoarchaeota archaeon]
MNLLKYILLKIVGNDPYNNLEIREIIGVIEPTPEALENNILDDFNKKIYLREGVIKRGNKIHWGRVIEEIPYSELAVESLREVKKIPIVERQISETIKFKKEKNFGEIII